MDMQNGMWLVPTQGRVTTKLPKLLKALIATRTSTSGRIIVERRDHSAHPTDYSALTLPENWSIVTADGETSYALLMAYRWVCGPSVDWLGYLTDDGEPITPGWDVKTLACLNGMNFVSTQDDYASPHLPGGAVAWSGDLIRAVGRIFPPTLNEHLGPDTWAALAKDGALWTINHDVLVRRNHPSQVGGDDEYKRANAYHLTDDIDFRDWSKTQRHHDAANVLAMMRAHGVEMFTPDLTGFRVALATPCGSGRYEGDYVDALMATMHEIRSFGGECHWLQAPHISDISLARNKIFAAFLRSTDTHLFWLDDDMIWSPRDVVRLLLSKKDFAAVAGPRKVSPPSFAVTVNDAAGDSIPIRMDAETGMLEVTGVGMAFACITRSCAERMAAQYADLEYEGADGKTDVAVFNNMVRNRRYKSEDFAFCQRWLDMGERIYVASDISLGHIGSHTWRGSWLDQLKVKIDQERAS